MRRQTNYDRFPLVEVRGHGHACRRGWEAVCAALAGAGGERAGGRAVVAVECYAGVSEEEVAGELRRHLPGWTVIRSADAFRTPGEVDRLTAGDLGGGDPVFGFYTRLTIDDFLDPDALAAVRRRVEAAGGPVVVCGAGATRCCRADVVVHADLPRWEGQLRQRRGEASNLGAANAGLKPSLQYKRSFFVDWRVCDRVRRELLPTAHFFLDTTRRGDPTLVEGGALRDGLAQAARRPFRVVPFFDPAPWGGQWMRRRLGIETDAPNLGWCFDCVPEENGLLLKFGESTVEVPAMCLVEAEPRAVLGEAVHGRFGAEFPIRFDFLDTVGGGNLSLQVHPTVQFAREAFGLSYTQDESYYLLDAEPGASVYLGLRDGVRPGELLDALEALPAEAGFFDAGRYVRAWPARRHDHFLIPAGTPHCSGAGAMVLEISATPYIFTFKLWDWGRLGLDGEPRPINLGRGRAVLSAGSGEAAVAGSLVNAVDPVARGPGWEEQRTGLHPSQFIETRRHWFTAAVPHDTGGAAGGGVNVLNLVEGEAAVVESPAGAFEPFAVHYAETFVVPAAVGPYTVAPRGRSAGSRCGTVKAFVRHRA